MKIPNPVAEFGEQVLVKNYRRKDIWEFGIISKLGYNNNFGSFSWSYTVTLNRRTFVTDNPICLYVGDEDIQPSKRAKNEKEA